MISAAKMKAVIPKRIKHKILKTRKLFFRLLYYRQRSNRYQGAENETILSDEEKPTFFGYHDKTPFSLDGNKILAMSIAASDTDPNSECTPMKIGYFAKNNDGVFVNEFVSITETTTWCFQQGCMLQWHPVNPNSQILFNNVVNGNYGAVLYDIDDKQPVKKYQHPIYSVDPQGKYAANLNFSRLGRLRPGYGYNVFPDDTQGIDAPNDDGLFLFELSNGKRNLIVNLADLAAETKLVGQHYINHATFSPEGNLLVFFHVCLMSNGKRKIRLCGYDIKQQKHWEVEKQRVASHYCWIDDFCVLVSNKDNYNTFRLTTFDLKKGIKADVLSLGKGDTHPAQSPAQNNMFILDSYPDIAGNQSLYVFDISKQRSKTIASVYSPLAFSGQTRCDLHPRWDRTGKKVIIDSARDGRRKMIVYDVTKAKTQNCFS